MNYTRQNRGMKGLLICALAAGIVGAGWLMTPASTPAAGGDDEQAVLQADHALSQAIAKSDKTGVAPMLDADFAWTDGDGKTRNKAQTLDSLPALATDSQGDTDVKTHYYGQLDLIAGTRHNDRFVRIWVKRPAGWRAFVDMDTPMPAEGRGGGGGGEGGGNAGANRNADCDNPCRTVPYKPATENEKATLTEWQKTKVDEWKAYGDDWGNHVAEEFQIINNGSDRNKQERVEVALRQQKAGAGAPGAPILDMKMYDFGTTVVMITHHVPYQGGKPYYNVRLFVHRDNHWPIAWSQQTTIQSAAPLPGAAAKK
jgi:hypothetical protein